MQSSRLRLAGVFQLTKKLASGTTGSRIFSSTFPSVTGIVKSERSLYEYMTAKWMKADPSSTACVQAESGASLSYSQLLGATENVAQILYHLGNVRKNDVVCISSLNTMLYTPAIYGALRLGARISTVNPVATADILAYYLRNNQAKVLVGMKYYSKILESVARKVELETGRKIVVLYIDNFSEALDSIIPSNYDGLSGSSVDDTIFIPFSSGTTGMPKGVQLTNKSLLLNIQQVCSSFAVQGSDVTISVLPIFHIFGFTCCLNAPLSVGATQIFMMKYSVDAFLHVIQKYKVSISMVAPPILASLLHNADRVREFDVSSLKTLRSGSAPLSADMEQKCERLFPGCTVAQGYGMTEMSPVVSVAPRHANARTYGSSGMLMPDTEIRVVRVDDSQQAGDDDSACVDADLGEVGEIFVRGPQIMKGYLKEDDTNSCMHNGWFRTGDIGRYDDTTKELFITDRLKELIKYKGYQVSPAEMENTILDHRSVLECVVFGVPDARDVSFEIPRALVVLKPGLSEKRICDAANDIIFYVKNRMPPHKRLHGGIRIVDSIPRNDTGKVMRRQIRSEEVKALQEQLGFDEDAEKN